MACRSISGPARLLSKSARGLSSVPEYLVNAPAASVGALGSGVKVCAEETGGATATVGVFIDVGSRYENAANNGIANVAAQVCVDSIPAADKAALGGHFSAVVDREKTAITATVLKKDAGKALGLIASSLAGATNADTLECEKAGVVSAIQAARDAPETAVMEHLHSCAYLDTAMGMPVLGTYGSVSMIQAEDVDKFKSTFYTADKTVVCAAGMTSGELTSAASGFDALPSAGAAVEVAADPAIFTGSDIRMRFDSMPETSLAIAFEIPGWNSPEVVHYMALAEVLGTWEATSQKRSNAWQVFLQQITEEDCVGTAASSFMTLYKDTGLFGIYGQMPDCRNEEFMYYATMNLTRLCHRLTDTETEFAKAALKSKLLAAQDGDAALCNTMGEQMLALGRRVSLAEMVARVDALTTAELKKAAFDVLSDQEHALAAVGPIYELPDYNWIRRRSFWLRY
uniref:Peptidase M16 C-terminal domain-containing protein n=1 Tax=Phaeomonas parva TaxID=124430 RepID=A0A6U4JTZ3_9STRA|mmetsp:Transcript_44675/g.140089  ORF Transcript_44675/g.140089 Transcript_44675/m.140089 type:complete len:456 (+) Transcript_44675:68-1435(+)|eukprot:CAMPEP_0118867702 /NCGR_PEP_ID=MMETSP1163-20130328/11214_1 /TAXON_ID=124430 /ORGANISM="Phaeomonas parva, Strain CCMP2877" /LENGTH=455 /DNA_ID=CAMNT_0006802145 /DNA_START=52 /DNA_END=1419 /DNA_ORIENTATION=+